MSLGARAGVRAAAGSASGSVRRRLTVLHRWAGLVLAGFLLLTGLTGSLLAWIDEIEGLLHPELHLVQPPEGNTAPIDPLLLREQLARRYPQAELPTVWLTTRPGRSLSFFLEPAVDPSTGKPHALANDQVFVHPYTGEVLGERRWGDIGQGLKNLMPFVYRLHYSLALDSIGQTVLGIVALVWTLDCFIGAWLTLPPRASPRRDGSSWLARWKPAWRVRWRAGGHRLNVDLHRAGGLWPWAMLFVLAWSSVAFNLSAVYHPVMRSVLAAQFEPRNLPPAQHRPEPPALDWHAARETARRLIAQQAAVHGYTVLREDWMYYDASRRVYRYDTTSTLDVSTHNGNTRVHFDADTGELRGLWLPTGRASADTVYTWLTSLHTAAMWGWPMKLFICVLGLLVAVLSLTGVVIWNRKRRARLAHAQR